MWARWGRLSDELMPFEAVKTQWAQKGNEKVKRGHQEGEEGAVTGEGDVAEGRRGRGREKRMSMRNPLGASGSGYTSFPGPSGQGVGEMEKLTKCRRRKRERTGSRPRGRRWGGGFGARTPSRGHWAGSEGGGRKSCKFHRKLRNTGSHPG